MVNLMNMKSIMVILVVMRLMIMVANANSITCRAFLTLVIISTFNILSKVIVTLAAINVAQQL